MKRMAVALAMSALLATTACSGQQATGGSGDDAQTSEDTTSSSVAVQMASVEVDAGTLVGLEDNGIYSFRGVPYATAERFKDPEPVTAYEGGTQLALSYGELTPQNAHILTECLWDTTGTVTGSGITLGLVVYMVFFAKSIRMRKVGRLGLGSGIFNINEPVVFGVPIVLNTKMLVPFALVPTVAYGMTYLLTSWSILPITYLSVPWTTPPILSGFLIGGWRMALWQTVEIAWSFFVYLPFARSQDLIYLQQERGG